MRRLSIPLVSFVAVLLASVPVKADSVPIATFTVSGSAGDWTLDFSVTNNTDQNLYLFAVELPTDDVTAYPAGWVNDGVFAGPSGTVYNNSWTTVTTASILPGDTLSGFEAVDTATAAPTFVPYLTATCDTEYGPFAECGGSPYTGSGNENTPDNAVFEKASPVPEPTSVVLLGIAVAMFVGVRKKLA
jgi:hypothetical protein